MWRWRPLQSPLEPATAPVLSSQCSLEPDLVGALAGLFAIVGGLLVKEKHVGYTNQVRAKNKFLLMYYLPATGQDASSVCGTTAPSAHVILLPAKIEALSMASVSV